MRSPFEHRPEKKRDKGRGEESHFRFLEEGTGEYRIGGMG